MLPKRLIWAPLLLAVAVGACSGDDDGDGAPSTAPATGCPVGPEAVAEAVAHPVTVERTGSGADGCTYVADDEESAGGQVAIVVRSLEDERFGSVLEEAVQHAGPTVPLTDGLVDGAEREWLVEVGRAVQVGAADGDTLVVVAVTDPLLDAEAARDVAARLAGDVLDR